MDKEISISFNVMITDRDIELIACMAEESIFHWCDNVKYEKGPEGDMTLTLHDKISDDTTELTYQNLVDGIISYLKNPSANDILEFIDHKLWIDEDQIDDDEVVDAIIQHSLFSKVKYKQ